MSYAHIIVQKEQQDEWVDRKAVLVVLSDRDFISAIRLAGISTNGNYKLVMSSPDSGEVLVLNDYPRYKDIYALSGAYVIDGIVFNFGDKL